MKNKPGRKKLSGNKKRQKIGISITKKNYDYLQKEEEMTSRIINDLLTEYFKKKYEK